VGDGFERAYPEEGLDCGKQNIVQLDVDTDVGARE
jgi:hypothetical protein